MVRRVNSRRRVMLQLVLLHLLLLTSAVARSAAAQATQPDYARLAHPQVATALGLIAAIPAVVAFNKLSNDMGRYAGRLEAFAGEFTSILSRQVEEAA